MEVDQYPEATFALTAPIEFLSVPPVGEQITASATGDLTLHGVTRPVTFDVTAEAGDDRIGVLGNIPVRFADYDIDNPSISGITTEDNGLLEFVLVFEPA
jgi:polyisoprenoid-binding protein YceI